MNTIREARDFILKNMDDGVRCPCCAQFVKVYKRKLNSAMACTLIIFYRRGGDTKWLHAPTVLRGTVGRDRDMGYLKQWGLVEERGEQKSDGNPHAGFYKINAGGLAFLTRGSAISKHLFFYNRCILSRSEDKTTISEALGDKFDYQQLMAA